MIYIPAYLAFISAIRLISLKLKERHLFFVFTACFSLWLLASFRSEYFGSDTYGYVLKYLSLDQMSLSDAWSDVFDSEIKDPFFYFFSKLISLFGFGSQAWLSILSMLFISSFGFITYRYSPEPLLSFILLICLGYLFFSFTGLRQTLAMSFTLVAFHFLWKSERTKFVVMVLAASVFHFSALIFLVALILHDKRIYRFYIPAITGAVILANFFGNQIKPILRRLVSHRTDWYFDNDIVLNNSGLIIQLAMFLYCIVYRKVLIKNDQRYIVVYNLLFIGILVQSMSVVLAEFFRLAMYFNIFNIILIPCVVMSEKNLGLRWVSYFIVSGTAITYLMLTGPYTDFAFYFNEVGQ